MRITSASTFTSDGSRIASACEDKTVTIWDAKTGKPLGSILHRGVAWSVAFDPDDKRVAVATWSKEGWVKTSPWRSPDSPGLPKGLGTGFPLICPALPRGNRIEPFAHPATQELADLRYPKKKRIAYNRVEEAEQEDG